MYGHVSPGIAASSGVRIDPCQDAGAPRRRSASHQGWLESRCLDCLVKVACSPMLGAPLSDTSCGRRRGQTVWRVAEKMVRLSRKSECSQREILARALKCWSELRKQCREQWGGSQTAGFRPKTFAPMFETCSEAPLRDESMANHLLGEGGEGRNEALLRAKLVDSPDFCPESALRIQ